MPVHHPLAHHRPASVPNARRPTAHLLPAWCCAALLGQSQPSPGTQLVASSQSSHSQLPGRAEHLSCPFHASAQSLPSRVLPPFASELGEALWPQPCCACCRPNSCNNSYLAQRETLNLGAIRREVQRLVAAASAAGRPQSAAATARCSLAPRGCRPAMPVPQQTCLLQELWRSEPRLSVSPLAAAQLRHARPHRRLPAGGQHAAQSRRFCRWHRLPPLPLLCSLTGCSWRAAVPAPCPPACP